MELEISNIASHLVAFLIGTGLGAAGEYYALKFTDQRRRQESRRELRDAYRNVRDLMPELMAEMENDLADPSNKTVRHFFLLPNEKVVFNTREPCLVYFEDGHKGLRGKVAVLENHGFVVNVTSGKVPKYQMTEAFVELAREHALH